jgi:hypothetical protein
MASVVAPDRVWHTGRARLSGGLPQPARPEVLVVMRADRLDLLLARARAGTDMLSELAQLAVGEAPYLPSGNDLDGRGRGG